MQKKGFTLIEIIVTIALLAIIGTVISINIVALNKKQEEKEKQRQESIVSAATEAYFDTTKQSGCVSVQELLDSNYIKDKNIDYFVDKYVSIEKDSNGNIIFNSYTSSKQCNKSLKKYTVVFNANGGSGTVPSIERNYGQKIDLNPFKDRIIRTGYSFAGWSESSQPSKKVYNNEFKITKNTTLYALWNINKYNINYNANGGTNAPSSQSGEYNTEVTLSSNVPQKEGHTFLGWSLSNSSAVAYTSGSRYKIPDSNTQLYAVWQINTYTITYETNGGSPIEQQSYVYNTQTNAPQNPSRNQDIFLGWYEDEALTKKHDFGRMPANNITLYAKYKRVYNFNLDVQFATAENIPTTIAEDQTLNIEFTADANYSLGELKCTNSKSTHNGNKIKVNNAIGDVNCTVRFYKNIYVALNSNNITTSSINDFRDNLKAKGLLVTVEKNTLPSRSSFDYEIKPITSVYKVPQAKLIGIIGENLIYQTSWYNDDDKAYYYRLISYNLYWDEELEDPFELKMFIDKAYTSGLSCSSGNSYGKINKQFPLFYYDNKLYFTTYSDYDSQEDGSSKEFCGSYYITQDSYYGILDIDYYYFEKDSSYAIYDGSGTYKTKSLKKDHTNYSWNSYSTNPIVYATADSFIDKSPGEDYEEAYNNSKKIELSTSSNLYYPIVMDVDDVYFGNQEDKIKTLLNETNVKNHLTKGIGSIKFIQNNGNTYYFENAQGKYGTLVYYTYDHEKYLKEVLLTPAYKSSLKKNTTDTSNYYKKYYVIDMDGITSLNEFYSDDSEILSTDFSGYTKILFNNTTTLPKAVSGGINYTSDYLNNLSTRIENDAKR